MQQLLVSEPEFILWRSDAPHNVKKIYGCDPFMYAYCFLAALSTHWPGGGGASEGVREVLPEAV